ncbi:MAG: NAD(P)H-dependent oxidoreductase [Sulfuricurvum sp.]|nr:NAD(P)H-dependent oxidoreductase [Sulfuricurvum sp.]
MRDDFQKAMIFRHACRLFDKQRKIAIEDLDFILESGRMSPSSIGLEQWKFLVVKNDQLKIALLPHVKKNTNQIATCSDLVCVLYKKQLRPDTLYMREQWMKIFGTEEIPEYYRQVFNARSDEELECWAKAQCYIATANMMTAAAFIGIDSCPMEGFEKNNVEETLGLDTSLYGVALMLPFGYRVNAQPEHKRSRFDEIVEYV